LSRRAGRHVVSKASSWTRPSKFDREEPAVPTIKFRAAAATVAAIGALAVTAIDANAATRPAGSGAPLATSASSTSRISAAPTDDGDPQQQLHCRQWTHELQDAQGFQLHVDGSTSIPQPNPKLEAIADAAMDDGCMVIY
jgi:hypothetical protein